MDSRVGEARWRNIKEGEVKESRRKRKYCTFSSMSQNEILKREFEYCNCTGLCICLCNYITLSCYLYVNYIPLPHAFTHTRATYDVFENGLFNVIL